MALLFDVFVTFNLSYRYFRKVLTENTLRLFHEFSFKMSSFFSFKVSHKEAYLFSKTQKAF